MLSVIRFESFKLELQDAIDSEWFSFARLASEKVAVVGAEHIQSVPIESTT